MSKLNSQQRNYLKGIESKKTRKKMKKEFIKSNKERPFEDSRSFLEHFFSTVSNPSNIVVKERNEQPIDFIKEVQNFAKLYNPNLVIEILESKPKNNPKTFTLEQMENCFNESRFTHPIIGFKHANFAEYLKSLENEK